MSHLTRVERLGKYIIKNQVYLFQNSFFGKPCTNKNIVPTLESSAESLQLALPSVSTPWVVVHCQQFTNCDHRVGVSVLETGKSHKDSFQGSNGAVAPQKYSFGSKTHSLRVHDVPLNIKILLELAAGICAQLYFSN